MNNLQNNQKSDATPMGYDTLLPTVFPCKKIRAGKYLYRGWIIGCAGYYHPKKGLFGKVMTPKVAMPIFTDFQKQK